MNVTGVYRHETMLRQITEAVRIRNTPGNSLLNTRTEWNLQALPHLNLTNSP